MTWRNLIAGAFASLIAILLAVQPASAITLNSGGVAIYNFDLTGQVPPPPYNQVEIELHFAPLGFPPAVFDVFGGLNAAGGLVVHNPGGFSSDHFQFVSDSRVNDGIFSVKITATDQVEVLSVLADAEIFSPQALLLAVPGELVTPLPAALPLFATGLGALGLLGWRRKKKTASLAA